MGLTVFREQLAWSPRSLKTAQSRGDLNGKGLALGYDRAQRVIETGRVPDPMQFAAPNSPTQALAISRTPDGESFRYDPAENLTGKVVRRGGEETLLPSPRDPSGRNRPGAIGGQLLSYDANGNLIARGDRTYAYDFRNRLTRYTELGKGATRFDYDAFNRRVEVSSLTSTRETVWHGWRPLEEYRDGQLHSRRTYGLGLDEIVRVEGDLDGNGRLEAAFVPLYDETGNLAAMTRGSAAQAAAGSGAIAAAQETGLAQVIERYEYSAYGQRRIFVDSQAPRVEQVRVFGGDLLLELSEEVTSESLDEALASGDLKLEEAATGTALAIELDQPVVSGRQARRCLVITTADPPSVGTELALTLPASALRDLFGNTPQDDFRLTFTWPAGDTILLDETPPRLEQVALRDGFLEIQLSEEPDLPAATAAIRLDGDALTWTLQEDRYTLRSQVEVDLGTHELTISTAGLDLAGLGLTESFELVFRAGSSQQEECPPLTVCSSIEGTGILFEAPDPREVSASTIANDFGFHGLHHDPETGLLYARNRYLDPEVGRFITQDPMGYVDGPSLYGFAGYDPLNTRDPLGLYQEDVHFYVIYYLARLVGFSSKEAYQISYSSQYVDDDRYSEPLYNAAQPWTRTKAVALHFAAPRRRPTDQPGDPGEWELVEDNNIFARAGVAAAARSGDLTRLGIALHTLADSFSHADFNLARGEHNRREGDPLRPDRGHADAPFFGQAPDLPFLEISKANRMAAAVLRSLQDALRRIHDRESTRYSSFEVDVIKAELMIGFSSGADEGDLNLPQVRKESLETRINMWKGLIRSRFGEVVHYDSDTGRPNGWRSAVDRHVALVLGMIAPNPGSRPIDPEILLSPW